MVQFRSKDCFAPLSLQQALERMPMPEHWTVQCVQEGQVKPMARPLLHNSFENHLQPDSDKLVHLQASEATTRSTNQSGLTDPFIIWCLNEAAKEMASTAHATSGRQQKYAAGSPEVFPTKAALDVRLHSCRQQGFCDDLQSANLQGLLEDVPVGQRASSGSEAETSSAQGFAVTTWEGHPTTLMIRNIPMTYSQEALALEWPNNGSYDFFYLPCSANMQRNKTYAFINFTSSRAAFEFKLRWEKGRLSQFTTRKALSITCADVQGQDETLLKLCRKRQWRLKVKECQPLIFDKNGVSITLEEAFVGLEEFATWSL